MLQRSLQDGEVASLCISLEALKPSKSDAHKKLPRIRRIEPNKGWLPINMEDILNCRDFPCSLTIRDMEDSNKHILLQRLRARVPNFTLWESAKGSPVRLGLWITHLG
ncbi:MAG: hypothetical protein DRH11_06680 [Deltaproteobacteria bacterium]|nr:MAG: hypothetical protein DRH11_06680 [Deltaproteobacteria bacterium]